MATVMQLEGTVQRMTQMQLYLSDMEVWCKLLVPLSGDMVMVGAVKSVLKTTFGHYEAVDEEVDAIRIFKANASDKKGPELMQNDLVTPVQWLYVEPALLVVEHTFDLPEPATQTTKASHIFKVHMYVQERATWMSLTLPLKKSEDGTCVTNIVMLKKCLVNDLGLYYDKEATANIRIFYNDSGMTSGKPLKGNIHVVPERWYTAILDPGVEVENTTPTTDIKKTWEAVCSKSDLPSDLEDGYN